jgi:hypothetical protein
MNTLAPYMWEILCLILRPLISQVGLCCVELLCIITHVFDYVLLIFFYMWSSLGTAFAYIYFYCGIRPFLGSSCIPEYTCVLLSLLLCEHFFNCIMQPAWKNRYWLIQWLLLLQLLAAVEKCTEFLHSQFFFL